ncbi:uncharacterized protein METZ01_LOCUS418906 [marine metagenome]|uniref:Uncharacterized protein n=1 Tax=marine metagenome TaxID=408172 RepID=A0A382X4N5_9ZZZZ
MVYIISLNAEVIKDEIHEQFINLKLDILYSKIVTIAR